MHTKVRTQVRYMDKIGILFFSTLFYRFSPLILSYFDEEQSPLCFYLFVSIVSISIISFFYFLIYKICSISLQRMSSHMGLPFPSIFSSHREVDSFQLLHNFFLFLLVYSPPIKQVPAA